MWIMSDGIVSHGESFQKHPVLGETAHGAILCKTVDEQTLQVRPCTRFVRLDMIGTG